MNIKVLFQKEGLVPVGTNDENQVVNLLNPIGTPTNVNFNFETGIVTMTIKSWDDRNEIVRDFELELPIEAWQGFLMTTFSNYIRPIAKQTYSEFDGLTELGVEII
jgi:hypothetical protein